MSIAYTLVPKDMYNSLLQPRASTTQNLDDYIIRKAHEGMQKAKTSKTLKGFARQRKYTSQLKNLMKTTRDVADRPVKVSVVERQIRAEKSPSPPPANPTGKAYSQRKARAPAATTTARLQTTPARLQLTPESVERPSRRKSTATPGSAGSNVTLVSNRSRSLPGHQLVFNSPGTDDAEEPAQAYAKQATIDAANETAGALPAPARAAPAPAAPVKLPEKTAPNTRSRKPKSARKLTPDERIVLIQEVLHLVKNNEEKYGLEDGKILRPDGKGVYTSIKAKDAVSSIVLQRIDAEHVGTQGDAVKVLKKKLVGDPDFEAIIKRQTGAGKRRSAPKADECQKGGTKQRAMKGEGKNQAGKGRKKGGKAKPKKDTNFRAVPWRKRGK